MAYHDSPCSGYKEPGVSWLNWRTSVFSSNTGCGGYPDYVDGPLCNKPTGYFSQYIPFQYFGEKQPVTLRQLYSYSNPCAGANTLTGAKNFCDNLRYINGDIVPPDQRPFACGGNGPNFFEYNAENFAVAEIAPELEDMQEDLQTQAEQIAKELQILWFAVIVIVIILILIRFL